MRLFISADMEGVAGVVTHEQLLPGGFEYEAARDWMTAEVSAVCEAASDAGIAEIVVADAHGNGQNIIPNELPLNVELVRSWPRPLGMMQGVDKGYYAGAVLLGYHNGAHSPTGGVAHTWSLMIRELRLDGLAVSETGICAPIAGHFGVPVIMASGDAAYIEHAKEYFGDVETVVTGESHSYLAASTITPAKSREMLAAATSRALARLGTFKPIRAESPIRVEVDLVNPIMTETLCFLPNFERLGAQSLGFAANDIIEVSRFLAFFGNVEGGVWSRLKRTW